MKEELIDLRNSIAPFAVWQIESLTATFARYIEFIKSAAPGYPNRALIRELSHNTVLIGNFLHEAAASKSMAAYNRAALELSLDIDSLIRDLDSLNDQPGERA